MAFGIFISCRHFLVNLATLLLICLATGGNALKILFFPIHFWFPLLAINSTSSSCFRLKEYTTLLNNRNLWPGPYRSPCSLQILRLLSFERYLRWKSPFSSTDPDWIFNALISNLVSWVIWLIFSNEELLNAKSITERVVRVLLAFMTTLKILSLLIMFVSGSGWMVSSLSFEHLATCSLQALVLFLILS